jgi:hypothetical protein
MAGKGNEATRNWAGGLVLDLRADVDACVAGLRAKPVPVDDVGEMSKRVRFVADIARAAKLIVALAPDDDEDEAEMSNDDRGHEPDDPVELERAGQELESRLDSLRATIEAKRLEGWAFTPRAPGADLGNAAPS